MTLPRRLAVAAATAAFITCSSVASAQVATSVTPIGLPPGASAFEPLAINNAGQAVGGIGSREAINQFVWTKTTWIDTGGGARVSLQDINDNGVAVGSVTSFNNGHPRTDGVIWDAVNGWRTMTGFSAASYVYPSGINKHGVVIGNSSMGPFTWDAVNGPTFLADVNLDPMDINDAGQIVGGDNATGQAFFWDPATNTKTNFHIGGASVAIGMNNRGQAVGYGRTPTGADHAFVWDAVSGATDIGALGVFEDSGEAFEGAIAYDINDHGYAVGYSTVPDGLRAFVWDKDNGMRDLTGQTWLLAFAINNNGDIVGQNLMDNSAFHAVIPIADPRIKTLEAQIRELQAAKAALETENGVLATHVAGLQGQVTLLNGQLSEAQAQIGTLQDQVSTLQSQNTTLSQQLEAATTAITTFVAAVQQDLRTTFGNAQFVIGGADVFAQLRTLSAALASLERGAKSAFYTSLGGSITGGGANGNGNPPATPPGRR